jgi:UDP-GlcNAc:undecaprenyl-phosphate GlcNAc-1-phosphate transferase
MDVLVVGLEGVLVGFGVAFVLRLLHPLARRYRFVDMPDHRKRHRRPTPLIGGYGLLVGLVLALAFAGFLGISLWWIFLGTVIALTVLGSVDDAYEVSARSRLLFQGAVVTAALWVSGMVIEQLGVLMGDEVVRMSFGLGLAFTVVCALAAINAYNMIDGIDGLAASQAGISLAGLMVLASFTGQAGLAVLAGFLVLALVVFMAFNLEIPMFRGRKAFLGDGGSTSLGFLLVWLLVFASQREPLIRPITAVWLVGLPILDMLAVFIRRLISGHSPFHADRGHIHHLLIAHDWSSRFCLGVLVLIQTGLVTLGFLGEWLGWTEFAMTAAIIGVGILYLAGTSLLADSVKEHDLARSSP